MSNKKEVWRLVTTDKEVIMATRANKDSPLCDDRGRILITVKSARAAMVCSVKRADPYLVKEMWKDVYSFSGSKVKFDHSPPRKGDNIAVIRESDGKVLDFKARLLQAEVCV